MPWKNLEEWSAGGDFKPLAKLTVKVLFRDYWLANVKDSLYNSSGTKTVAKATSAHVGEGVDAQFTYAFEAKTGVGIGVANLDPGSYLVQSKKTTPYLYVLRRL